MSSEAQRAFERAEALNDMGRYDEAVGVLQQALSSEPDDGDLLNLLSIVFHNLERYGDALSSAQRALAAEPDVEGARHVVVSCLWHLARRTDALEAARQTATYEPWCVRTWFDIAWIAGELGFMDEAREAATEALELDPDEPDAWRAAAYAGLAEEETIHLLQRGIAIAPDDALLHNDIGWGFLRHGRFAEAEPFLRRSIEIDPLNPIPRANLAASYRWQGRTAEAAELKRRALELRVETAENRLARDPDDVGARVMLGADLWDEGHHGKALEHFRSALEVEPDHVIALVWLGFTQMTLGRRRAARVAIARALELEPDSQMALYARLELAYHEGKPRTALQTAKRLRDAIEEDWLTEEGLGLAALTAGRYDDAIDHLESVLLRNATRCCSYALLGIAHARAGAAQEARDAAAKRDLAAPNCNCIFVRELQEILQ
jgi:tetratricopeptide (TPR) repeat protein